MESVFESIKSEKRNHDECDESINNKKASVNSIDKTNEQNVKKQRTINLKIYYSPDSWLNDEVVNGYMDLINDRDPNSVYALNTFFYNKLSTCGYQSVARWTKKRDIFAYKKLLIPLNLNYHWSLICVNFVEKTIKYYDSLNFIAPNLCLNYIFYYLKEEHINKKGVEFDIRGWCKMVVEDCPKQQNHFDCGVFTCIFAEHLARDEALNFTQNDILKLRHRICDEIRCNSLCNCSIEKDVSESA